MGNIQLPVITRSGTVSSWKKGVTGKKSNAELAWLNDIRFQHYYVFTALVSTSIILKNMKKYAYLVVVLLLGYNIVQKLGISIPGFSLWTPQSEPKVHTFPLSLS